jgi:hypothetical protein
LVKSKRASDTSLLLSWTGFNKTPSLKEWPGVKKHIDNSQDSIVGKRINSCPLGLRWSDSPLLLAFFLEHVIKLEDNTSRCQVDIKSITHGVTGVVLPTLRHERAVWLLRLDEVHLHQGWLVARAPSEHLVAILAQVNAID